MIELLALMLRCPVCNNKYNAEQTSIIDGSEAEKYGSSTVLVHTDCESCKSSVVFSVSMDGPEIFSVGMVTDLTSTDAKKFTEAGHVSLDEVIEFNDFIRSFDGDFERILK